VSSSHLARRYFNQTTPVSIVNANTTTSVDKAKDDPNADNIPRCDNCKAFVNPFFEFQVGRKSYKCNLCQQVQPTPKQYQDPYGDYSNSELSLGTYEFYASAQYTARTPKEPSYLFLVDISKSSYQSHVPFYAIAAIKEAIRSNRFNGSKSVSISIVLFDTQLHLVQLRPNGKVTLSTLNYTTDIRFLPTGVF